MGDAANVDPHQNQSYYFESASHRQKPETPHAPSSPNSRNYTFQRSPSPSPPRFHTGSLPQLNSSARRTPTPTPITDVMAAMTDQSRAVQALKEAVNGVDSLRSPIHDPNIRNQWRSSSSPSFRSKSVDQFYRYQQPFQSPDFVSRFGTEYSIPSFHNSQPVQSVYNRSDRSTSPTRMDPTSSNNRNNHESVSTNQTIYSHAKQMNDGEFERKMHEIVNNAVSKAISKESLNSTTNDTSTGPPTKKVTEESNFDDRIDDEVMHESELSGRHVDLSPSLSPIPKSSKPDRHRHASFEPPMHNIYPQKRDSFSSEKQHLSTPSRKQTQTQCQPRQQPHQRQHVKSSSVSTTSTTKRTPSTVPLFSSSESQILTSLTEKVNHLLSRIQDLESRDTAHLAINKFEVDKTVKTQLKAFESRMNGMDAKVLQMEARQVVERVDLGKSGLFLEIILYSSLIKLDGSGARPDEANSILTTLVQCTIPALQLQTDSLTSQLSTHQISNTELVQDLQSTIRALETANRRLQSQLDESLESIKVLQGRFDFQLVAMENLRETVKEMAAKGGGMATGYDEKRIMDCLDGVSKSIKAKVDTIVLEELMRHLATRDELKRMYDKLSEKREKGRVEVDLDRVRWDVFEELKKHVEMRLHNFKAEVVAERHQQTEKQQKQAPVVNSAFQSVRRDSNIVSMAQLHETLDVLEHRWLQQLEQATTSPSNKIPSSLISELKEDILDHVKLSINEQLLDQTGTTLGTPSALLANKPMQSLIASLTREFDEKLYLLCNDLSACKTAYQTAVRQPFYRCAQWLWTSSSLKLGSSIPWNLQSTNTDPLNFKWEKDAYNIRVQEAGFYEITFAFFDVSWKPSIQIVVNGESVMSALNSPAYVVHHSSGFVRNGEGEVRPGTVTGLSLIDFLSLPAKSTIALHYHGGKKELVGHGFLGLRRL
ncbi:UNVERIFIED_CONTAM: hypothetical protein HDU68_012528 [Siphonaria sp. JEL0065]|nr:hypothetical protein HDU68_012528 [Siphonaria sp. JEL0065]